MEWARWPRAAAIAVLIAGTGWLGSLARHRQLHEATDPRAGRLSAPALLPAFDALGGVAPLHLAARQRPLLLLVVSAQCPYCADNMQAWRRLAASWRAAVPAADVLALSIGSSGQTADYLREHGLAVDFRTIDAAVLPLLGATGYPTTAVYLPQDRTLAVWAGVLGEAEHEAVMALAASGHE